MQLESIEIIATVGANPVTEGHATARPAKLSTRLRLFPLWDPSSSSPWFLSSWIGRDIDLLDPTVIIQI